MDQDTFHVVVDVRARRARLIGELDLASADLAAAQIAPLLEEPGAIELDLSELTFMDSSGIRVLIQTREHLGERGSLAVCYPQPHVAKILEIAGVKDLGIELR